MFGNRKGNTSAKLSVPVLHPRIHETKKPAITQALKKLS